MGTTTKLTFDEWLGLPEREGTIYELDEGDLVLEPSPTLRHNRIRDRIARCLADFVQAHRLGEVTVEMDFRLGPTTVRNPDVAFIATEHLQHIDPDRSPIDGAPALAVEVVSPTNLAQDMPEKSRPVSFRRLQVRLGSLSSVAAGGGTRIRQHPQDHCAGIVG